jgi:hypothetical protein
MLIHRTVLVGFHMKQASHRLQVGVRYMSNSCVLFMYNVYKGYSQETVIFATNSVYGFCTKL